MNRILLCLILLIANTFAVAEVPAQYEQAAQKYFMYSIERLKNSEEILERLSRKLEAGQHEAAKEDYVKAHYQYESVRPLILLFPNLNTLLDTHLSDVSNKQLHIQNFIGFNAVEYELYVHNDSARAFVETQKLINNLRIVIEYLQTQHITFNDMVNLLPAFAQQILNNKLSGYDNQPSGISLGEIAANLEGIHLIMNQLRPFLPTLLLKEFEHNENDILTLLQNYKLDDLYHPYSTLKDADKTLLEQETMQLSTLILQMNGLIAKQRNTLSNHSVSI